MADTDPNRVPVEELAAQYVERLRRGEFPTVEDYVARYPDMAEEIRDLFPAVAAMEQLKAHSERGSDGRASLGPVKLARLGDYRIVREIGRGGMGVVYEAQQESLDRRVALKVLPREALHDRKQLVRFQREARLAARLHHTNIVQVYGFGEEDGFYYYPMQFVHGVGLDHIIGRLIDDSDAQEVSDENRLLDAACRELGAEPGKGPHGTDKLRRVARLGAGVARALAYAHSQGTLHRDIKPGNLLLDDAGTIWVTDFGLAMTQDTSRLTQPGLLAGTLRYMPPERFSGPAGAAGDLYCLGLTLWELAICEPVFDEADHAELVRRIREGDTPPPRATNPEIPRDLEAILLKAAAPEPEDRYPSARAMALDLQRFMDGLPVEARPIHAPERFGRWCNRNKLVASLSMATFLLAVLVAVVASAGYVRTRAALRAEAEQRTRAETVVAVSLDALDKIFEQLASAGAPSTLELALDSEGSTSVQIYTPPPIAPETAALLEQMLPIYDRLAEQTGSDEKVLARAADASRRIGLIHQRLGAYDEAFAAYDRALKICEGLPESELLQAQILNETGRAHLLAGATESAREDHLAALDVMASATNPGSPELVYELARTHYMLGTRPQDEPAAGQRGGEPDNVASTDGPRGPRNRRIRASQQPLQGPPAQPAEAAGHAEHLTQAIKLLEGLEETAQVKRLLALCLRDLAGAKAPDDPDAARASYTQAVAIQQELVQAHPEDPVFRYDLAETYLAAQQRNGEQGRRGPTERREVSTENGRQAVTLAQQLVDEHPTVPEYRALLARACHTLSRAMPPLGESTEALDLADRAVAAQTEVVKQLRGVTAHAAWLGVYRNDLAGLLTRNREFPRAKMTLTENIEDLEELLKANRDVWYLHRLLAQSYGRLAMLSQRIGDTAGSERAAAKESEHDQQAGGQFGRLGGQGRRGPGAGEGERPRRRVGFVPDD